MKMRFVGAALAAVATLCLASLGVAGTVSVVEVPNGGISDGSPANLTGTVTTDIILDSTDDTILSQQIYLTLNSGSVFNHNFGSNTPPNSLLVPAFPALAFDTFLSAGTANNGGGAAPSPTIVGKSDALGGPGGVGAVLGPNQIDALWGPSLGQDTANQANYLSIRFTLSPDANGLLSYRTSFGTGFGGLVDIPIEGGHVMLPPDGIAPDVEDFLHPQMDGSAAGNPMPIMHTFTQVGGTDPITWDNFMLESYTPNYSGEGTGPFFDAEFDPLTQKFSWNPIGSPRGDYVWKVTASNDTGEDVGRITVQIKGVPEPATFALIGLGLVGLVGVARRRS